MAAGGFVYILGTKGIAPVGADDHIGPPNRTLDPSS